MTKTETDPDHNTHPDQAGPVALLRKLLPWAVLVFLFVVLFSRVPFEQVVGELRALTPSQIIELSLLSIVFIIGVSVLDGIAMGYGFSVFGVKIKWKEIIMIRSAMMLLASIATLIGQAGLAALIAKKHKIPAGKAAGTVMFLFLVEIYGMITLASVALPVLFIARYPEVGRQVPVLVAVGIIGFSWSALVVMFIIGRSETGANIIRGLRLSAILHPLQTIRPGQFIRLLLLKTLLGAWQIGLTALVFSIYGIDIPGLELFAFMPLAILVSSIPVTPARLGTTQWSWMLFFGHLVSPAALIAFSLLLQFMLNVARWLIGGIALPFIYKDLIHKPKAP